MAEIKLTQGQVAIVDDADFEFLSQWKWCAEKAPNTFYAVSGAGCKRVRMHRLLLDTPIVDHINGNGLDNRRENLRPANKSQNAANRRDARIGVSWNKNNQNWRSRIMCQGVTYEVGSFPTEEKAREAYAKMKKKLFGEFA